MVDMLDLLTAQKEVYEWALTKGWEPDPERKFADACALMHSEVSEALEAYRTWKFEDVTREETACAHGEIPKPEGVASELADVLIRVLHYCKVYSLQIDVERRHVKHIPDTFGEECAQMHESISAAYVLYRSNNIPATERALSKLYDLLIRSCVLHGFDLGAEYRRKMDYNYTRVYRHGGKAM